MMPFHARQLAFALGLEGKQVSSAVKFMLAMYKAFTSWTPALWRSTRLVVTGAGEIIALDAKMNFDDNALYRHQDIAGLRDPGRRRSGRKLKQTNTSLNYVNLDGKIGCMVNGAGSGHGDHGHHQAVRQ